MNQYLVKRFYLNIVKKIISPQENCFEYNSHENIGPRNGEFENSFLFFEVDQDRCKTIL